ncbi:MAG: hypothetical protein M3Z75_27465 [Actinomycetota bacterium]|nr:hypothetical protein [Actinomycetota bacterium]
MGTAGTYQVGIWWPSAFYLGQRKLVIMIDYPLAQGSASPQPASGRFPLLLFAPGYTYCGGTYEHLLQTWASAGYVVAAVNFPYTDCQAGAALNESDIVNQPQDMSYVLSKLLRLSAQPGNVLSGLLNPSQVAAAGQSDGGDTVAALAANTCCRNTRLKAVAVLSGAVAGYPGKYFSHGAPPMLFTQGSADTVNPPSASIQLYRADGDGARYYLDLVGASHMTPYAGTNPTEQLVARVTLAFFDRYVLGQDGALATMMQDGNVSNTAALVDDGQLPPSTGLSAAPGTRSGSVAPHPSSITGHNQALRRKGVGSRRHARSAWLLEPGTSNRETEDRQGAAKGPHT